MISPAYEDEGFPGCWLTPWSEWSVSGLDGIPCSHECRVDESVEPFQWRVRWVRRLDPGATCPPLYERRDCEELPPICDTADCEMGEWGEWGMCSGGGTVTCGTGTTFRYRPIVTQPKGNDAKPCENQIEFTTCEDTSAACVALKDPCVISSWSFWHDPDDPSTACSARCGGGTQIRIRTATAECPASTVTREERACNTHSCATDCQLHDSFTPVGGCSRPCGTAGVQKFVKGIKVFPSDGGFPCPSLEARTQYRACNRFACPPEETGSGGEGTGDGAGDPGDGAGDPGDPGDGAGEGDPGDGAGDPGDGWLLDSDGRYYREDWDQYIVNDAPPPPPPPPPPPVTATPEPTIETATTTTSQGLPDWFPESKEGKLAMVGGAASAVGVVAYLVISIFSSPAAPPVNPTLLKLGRKLRMLPPETA